MEIHCDTWHATPSPGGCRLGTCKIAIAQSPLSGPAHQVTIVYKTLSRQPHKGVRAPLCDRAQPQKSWHKSTTPESLLPCWLFSPASCLLMDASSAASGTCVLDAAAATTAPQHTRQRPRYAATVFPHIVSILTHPFHWHCGLWYGCTLYVAHKLAPFLQTHTPHDGCYRAPGSPANARAAFISFLSAQGGRTCHGWPHTSQSSHLGCR